MPATLRAEPVSPAAMTPTTPAMIGETNAKLPAFSRPKIAQELYVEAIVDKRTEEEEEEPAQRWRANPRTPCLMTFRAEKARRTAGRGWLPSRQRRGSVLRVA
jgi:hypothetical protein